MEDIRIKQNIDNPEELERLFRDDRKAFETAFAGIWPEISEQPLARFWKARLDFEKREEPHSKVKKRDLISLFITIIIAGILVRIPDILGFDEKNTLFYERNLGLIFFFGLSLYTFITRNITVTWKLIFLSLAFMIPCLFINLLPYGANRDSVNLAYIHLPFMLWFIYGVIFIGFRMKDMPARVDYIRYNGDLAILGGLILIAGVALLAITMGLFSAIGMNAESFLMDNIAIWGVASVPLVANFFINNYPSLTNKIAPVIASVFSPLVLITLVIFLASIPISGKNPYSDRNFLLLFNIMLIAVMAIIAFSTAGISSAKPKRFNIIILFLLSVVSLIINIITLSAIVYRLGEFGFSPNKSAVLGLNILVFVHLTMIMLDLFKVIFRGESHTRVEKTIVRFLPVYAFWTLFVVFAFPLIFGFR